MCCLIEQDWELENAEGPDLITEVLKVLEPDAGKLARPVLRGGSHGNVTFLPNRLIEVSGHNCTVTYTYDAFQRRLSKTVNGEETLFLYQGQNEIGAIQHGEIVQLRILGTGHGAEIGAAIALELQAQVYVPVHDLHGSIINLVDLAGNLVEAYRYSAFGEEEIYNASSKRLTESAVGNPWRYRSKRVDPETGLVYFGRRYYAAELGRWITPDPQGFEDGPNLYAYLTHSPLLAFDLYGLERLSKLEDSFTWDERRLSSNHFHNLNEALKDSVRPSNTGFSLSSNFLQSNHPLANSGSYFNSGFSSESFFSNAWNTTTNFLSSPRFHGSMQAVTGFTEIYAGAMGTIVTGGFGGVVGVPAMMHGVDQLNTGFRTILSGTPQISATERLLHKM